MLRFFFFFVFFNIIIAGCNNNNNTKQPVEDKLETDTGKNNFFPVTQYLLGQIKMLDTLPITPLKIITVNRKTDSTWVRREDIKLFVQPFINPVIDSATYAGYFSENSFLDQTINAFTFSYDPVKPLPDSFRVRRWDVYIDPQSNTVKRVYIVQQTNTPKQTIQLTWKPGYSCKITTITDFGDPAQQVKQQEIIWNF